MVRGQSHHVTIFVAAVCIAGMGCGARNSVSPSSEAAQPQVAVVPADVTTAALVAPLRESTEANAVQLGRAAAEGNAVTREIDWVSRNQAVASGEVHAGQYVVAYLITPADDYYDMEAAQSDLPAHHTTVLPGSAHVGVVVRDAADGRLVPGLNVSVTLRADRGTGTGGTRSASLPYGWHPVLNRYGENVVLPSNSFALSVRISMPRYARHDSVNGKRFGEDVVASFAHVSVPPESLAVASERLARGDAGGGAVLARSEGSASDRSLTELLRSAGVSGSQARSGDYRVTVLVQRPRGLWQVRGGGLRYMDPDSSAGPAAHIDVVVQEAASGRFVQDLQLRATILDSRRRETGSYTLPMMWHPWMNHYGLTVPVPASGRYSIRVRAAAPAFRRYGSGAAKQFNRALDVTVHGVRLQPLLDD